MARHPSPPSNNRAARKIRAWRTAGNLTGEAAAEQIGGTTAHQIYRYERGMRRVPDAVRARLVDLAVCSWEDFHTEDAVAVCERCAVPPDSPEAACCTRADCPRRVMGQSELETAA